MLKWDTITSVCFCGKHCQLSVQYPFSFVVSEFLFYLGPQNMPSSEIFHSFLCSWLWCSGRVVLEAFLGEVDSAGHAPFTLSSFFLPILWKHRSPVAILNYKGALRMEVMWEEFPVTKETLSAPNCPPPGFVYVRKKLRLLWATDTLGFLLWQLYLMLNDDTKHIESQLRAGYPGEEA